MIYLVRHGETTWNRVGRRQGHNDSPLTELGIEQARAAGRVLQRAIADIHNVCIETSPLGRARQTALIVGEILGLDPNAILVAPLLIAVPLASGDLGITVNSTLPSPCGGVTLGGRNPTSGSVGGWLVAGSRCLAST